MGNDDCIVTLCSPLFYLLAIFFDPTLSESLIEDLYLQWFTMPSTITKKYFVLDLQRKALLSQHFIEIFKRGDVTGVPLCDRSNV